MMHDAYYHKYHIEEIKEHVKPSDDIEEDFVAVVTAITVGIFFALYLLIFG